MTTSHSPAKFSLHPLPSRSFPSQPTQVPKYPDPSHLNSALQHFPGFPYGINNILFLTLFLYQLYFPLPYFPNCVSCNFPNKLYAFAFFSQGLFWGNPITSLYDYLLKLIFHGLECSKELNIHAY